MWQIFHIIMFIVVTLTYPSLCQSIVNSLGQIFFDREDLSFKQRMIIVPVANLITIGIAMVRNDVGPIYAFGGSLGGNLILFCFPSLCRLKTSEFYWLSFKNFRWICLFIFGISIAVLCSYSSSVKVIQPFNDWN